MRTLRRGLLRTVPGVLAALVWTQAPAGDWDLDASVDTALIWSDNLDQSVADEARDSTVLQLTPRIQASRAGARASLQTDYELRAVIPADSSADGETAHRLNALLASELVRTNLFLDAGVTYTQRQLDPARSVAVVPLVDNANQDDVLTTNVEPRFRTRVGERAELVMSANFGTVDYRNSETGDSTRRGGFIGLSTPVANRIGWSATYSIDDIDGEQSDERFERATAGIRYSLAARTRAELEVGWDREELVTTEETAQEGGSWKLGIDWVPDRQTRVTASVGERYFGSTGSLLVERRTRRLDYGLSYSETVTTPALQLLENPDSPVDVAADDGAFVLTSVQADVGYRLRRLTLSFSAYQRTSDFRTGNFEDQVRGANLSANLRRTESTNWLLRLERQRSEFGETGQEDRLQSFALQWRKSLARNASLGADYTRAELTSNQPSNEYRENRIGVNFRKDF